VRRPELWTRIPRADYGNSAGSQKEFDIGTSFSFENNEPLKNSIDLSDSHLTSAGFNG